MLLAAVIEALTYEGYGPGGVALLINCLTDNRKRTAPALRHLLSKYGGNLGEAGCVAWMFNRRGVITVAGEGKNLDELSLAVIDAGAQDMETNEDELTVYSKPTELTKLKKELEQRGLKVLRSELLWVPKETVKIEDPAVAKKLMTLLEILEDDEDVDEVSANFDIPDQILSQAMTD